MGKWGKGERRGECVRGKSKRGAPINIHTQFQINKRILQI